ncbi:transketolase [uncultured archaeon]|nr:transketolase [uncultured archaeon]
MQNYSVSDLKKMAASIRTKSVEMVYAAKSGHPGGSLSLADILSVLYFKELNIDPLKPNDPDRDRVVLSKGHASPGFYATLSLRGYFPESLLSGFRKLNSKLEGHVHRGVPGVEASTGSLGQGFGIGVGMALAARLDGKSYRTYVILGDGEIEEGSVWESLMSGYKYKLSNLTAIIDRNRVQQTGNTDDIMPLHDLPAALRSFGWNTIEIDGHNIPEIIEAIHAAKGYNDGPTVIVANTVKGKGVSYMENNPKYHGSPPKDENEFRQALEEIAGGL